LHYHIFRHSRDGTYDDAKYSSDTHLTQYDYFQKRFWACQQVEDVATAKTTRLSESEHSVDIIDLNEQTLKYKTDGKY